MTLHLARVFAILTAVIVLEACTKKPPPPAPPPPSSYTFCIDANDQLNWYDKKPHTVFVRLFRLSSGDAFLATGRDALIAPQPAFSGAEGAPLDLTVHPGQRKTVEIPLAPTARYIGVLAMFADETGRDKVVREMTVASSGEAKCLQLGRSSIEVP